MRTPKAAALLALLCGCEDPNTGVDPPADRLFFPSGLLLDPRISDTGLDRGKEPVHYLIVSNGNNDLNYNAGSVVVIDLDAFFAAWATRPPPTDALADPTDADFAPYPYCEGPGQRCVLGVGAPTNEDFPCRRLGLLPQVVECDERSFVVDSVRVGDFATVMTATTSEPSGVPRIFLPVRGDPSITFVDVAGPLFDAAGNPSPPDLQCGQGTKGGEADDNARCADFYRLRHLRNDDTLEELDREPFNIEVAEGNGYRYALVAHSAGRTLTLIDLDGLRGEPGRPAIVDTSVLFTPTGQILRSGGFGLAQRPCGTCVAEDDPPGTNVPTLTQNCTRPMLYASYRYQLTGVNFTADGIDPATLPPGAETRRSCCGLPDADTPVPQIPPELDPCVAPEVYVGAFCATPDDIGDACAVICEPQVRSAIRFNVAGVDPLSPTSAAALGDIEFGDRCGDDLYMIQTNPGALLHVDTSLDLDNETFDISSGPPIELCDQPTRLEIWQDAAFAFVACFQSAYIYVVDLSEWKVVDTVIAGTGPHDLVVDEARELLYVANTLEGSVSVIDVGEDRPTRFKEVARIGLQEPFRR